MAKALLMSGGVGGITSDDVTAKKWHVVQGFTALTSDSGDEPANGELANKGNGGAPNGVICPEMFYYTLEGAYVARFDAGAYYNTGERGQWKPYVSVPVWMAKQATNYHPEKTLSDTVTCQERGTVKMIDTKLNNYTNNQARNIGIDSGRGKLWMELGHGNAYYYRDDNVPHVETDSTNFGDVTADKVMRGYTATSKNGVKFAGTMPDYSSGRVAFRNATFDNVLVLGVANIGLGNNLNVYSKPSIEIRDGIIKFYNGGSVSGGGLHQYRSNTVLEEAVTLAHSVNLTPFRTIRLGLKYPYGGRWGTVGGVGSLVGILWALPTNITPEYVPSRNAKINPNVIKRAGYKDGVIPATQGQWNTPTEIPAGAEYFVDIDVSDLQGHHRIVLGMAVSEANHREDFTIQVAVYVNNGISGISHIEFIN